MTVALAPMRHECRAFSRQPCPIIVEEQRAAAVIEPEHAEEKSDVADARGDERFLRRCGRARFVNPEPNQQIRREPDQFPANEEQEQAVRDDHAEHRGGEKRERSRRSG